jgi:hypothetical protein
VRSAADELTRVAARFESKALVAGATHAQGRVRLAEGDPADAERYCAEAARLWNEVGAPYEAALARVGFADALRASGREQRAALELAAARAVLDRIEAERTWCRSNGTAKRSRYPSPASTPFAGRATTGRWSSRGAPCECETSRASGTSRGCSPTPVVSSTCSTSSPPKAARLAGPTVAVLPTCRAGPGDAGEMLDVRAKDAYRRRLAEIEDDIEQARALEDTEREAQADAERDFLVRELSRAVGLHGRDRRAASTSERARASVTRAVRQGMARVGEHHPELGEHLDRTIRTGTYCAYVPDPRAPAAWRS